VCANEASSNVKDPRFLGLSPILSAHSMKGRIESRHFGTGTGTTSVSIAVSRRACAGTGTTSVSIAVSRRACASFRFFAEVPGSLLLASGGGSLETGRFSLFLERNRRSSAASFSVISVSFASWALA